MLQNRVIAPSTDPFPIELHTKHVFSKNANELKSTLIFFFRYLHKMFIEYFEEYA